MLLEGLIIELMGQNHKDKGEELPFFHRLPIPKQLCAYTRFEMPQKHHLRRDLRTYWTIRTINRTG